MCDTKYEASPQGSKSKHIAHHDNATKKMSTEQVMSSIIYYRLEQATTTTTTAKKEQSDSGKKYIYLTFILNKHTHTNTHQVKGSQTNLTNCKINAQNMSLALSSVLLIFYEGK